MKKFISIFLTAVILCSIFSTTAMTTFGAQTDILSTGDYVSGYYYYTVSDNKATITNYTGSETTLAIPSEIGGYEVTGIGEKAFYERIRLTSVTIPDSVTSIGNSAFYSCKNLKSITIPYGVISIGEDAFSICESLTSITIPDGVISIGDSAFEHCTNLKRITIPDSVTSIGEYAFRYCTNLTSIIIPEGVSVIGTSTFNCCSSLKSITLPDGLTSIGMYAFHSCKSLTSIVIPENVTSINDGVFSYCESLISITVDKGNTVYDSREDCNAIIETSTDTLIAGCCKTIIPEGVTGIGYYAFGHCTTLIGITIPDSVTRIGEGAFYSCSGLISITLENSVTSIEEWAFYSCPKLKMIAILNKDCKIHNSRYTFYEPAVLYAHKKSTAYDYAMMYNRKFVELDADDHTWGDAVVTNATCENDGINVKTCAVCGKVKSEIIPSKGHTEIVDKAVAPSCTERGLTEGKHCSVCDKVFVTQEVVPATGHTEVIDNAVAPTCTETGLTEGKHCSVCNEVLAKQNTISAHGHIYKETCISPPHCNKKGYTIYNCEYCDNEYIDNFTPPTGHIAVWQKGRKQANYFTKGYTGDSFCDECNTTIKKGKFIEKLKLKTPTVKYTGSKKKLTVKYTKVKDATGFKVKYKIGKKTVTKTYNTKKSVSKTISKLKKGTYKVQVRAFIKSGSKKAYSSWTKAKKVKVK